MNPKILIVDDSEPVRRAIRSLLRKVAGARAYVLKESLLALSLIVLDPRPKTGPPRSYQLRPTL